MGTFAGTANVNYVYRLPTRENRFPFTKNKRRPAISFFRLQQTNGSCPFPLVLFSVYIYIFIYIYTYLYLYLYLELYLYIYIYTYIYIYIYIYCRFNRNQKTEAQAIFFLNPFTIFSSCKQKFVVCLFVYKETYGDYPFANGLSGLAHLTSLILVLKWGQEYSCGPKKPTTDLYKWFTARKRWLLAGLSQFRQLWKDPSVVPLDNSLI
jgi:hypothetical protein